MVNFKRAWIALGLALSTFGCATTFTGSAHIDGRPACEHQCRSEGMELAGMVYMGEYSSACVCQVPGQSASTNDVLLGGAAATSGGAVAALTAQRNRAANSSSSSR